jgi:hypothetical protein
MADALKLTGAGVLSLPRYYTTAGILTVNASGVVACAADGAAGKYLKTNGAGVWSWDTPAATVTAPLDLVVNDISATAYPLRVTHTNSGGVGSDGLTVGYELALEGHTPGVAKVVGSIESTWTDLVGNGAARLDIRTAAAGGLTTVISLLADDDSTGYCGIMNPAPAYPLDVTGDVNTTTRYRAGGTAGLSGTYNFTGTAGSTKIKTMTFVGGILTATTAW